MNGRRLRHEDYLAAVENLCEEGGLERASTGAIAERLGVSKGLVSTLLKEFAADGLVDLKPYEGVRLTEQGRRVAMRVVRRYRLLELFLSRALDIGWDTVAEEARRLEPGLSEALEERVDTYLGCPEYDPHGDPIPRPDGSLPSRILVRVTDLPPRAEAIVRRVLRQPAETLRYLSQAGVDIGARVTVEAISSDGGFVLLCTPSGQVPLGHTIAAAILVQPVAEGSQPLR